MSIEKYFEWYSKTNPKKVFFSQEKLKEYFDKIKNNSNWKSQVFVEIQNSDNTKEGKESFERDVILYTSALYYFHGGFEFEEISPTYIRISSKGYNQYTQNY